MSIGSVVSAFAGGEIRLTRPTRKRFFDKATSANGDHAKVTTDKSGANKTDIDEINASRNMPILMPQAN